MVKVGINGFGRVGRQAFRALWERHRGELEVVAVNDLAKPEASTHLLKYDSTYGRFPVDVALEGDKLVIDGWRPKMLSIKGEKDNELPVLPWGELGVDLVIEATGRFTDGDKARDHLSSGARKVIISAPAKNHDVTIVMGVNEIDYDSNSHYTVSNASCTTNCLAPVVKVLDKAFGIEKGFMSTVHAYTNDQQLLDMAHKDTRRARAAAVNTIPAETGAAEAIGQVLPGLSGKLHGMAFRVPTAIVSVVDLVVVTRKRVGSADQVNAAFCQSAEGELRGILRVETQELVSADFRGDSHSAIIDAPLTKVLPDNLVKVVAWYDNEWAYAARIADLATYMTKKGTEQG